MRPPLLFTASPTLYNENFPHFAAACFFRMIRYVLNGKNFFLIKPGNFNRQMRPKSKAKSGTPPYPSGFNEAVAPLMPVKTVKP